MINLNNLYKNKALGDMNAAELVMCMHHSINTLPGAKAISDAADLSTFLHAHQTRKTRNEFERTPYIEHPLRNTLRLLRWGVTDTDVLVASLLHDTVEDTAPRFTKRVLNKKVSDDFAKEQLLDYIAMVFGVNTAAIVEGVTNPQLPKDPDEKAVAYRKHVTKAIHNNPGVYLVKLSDFVDNAVGLWHSPDDQFIARQAAKYQPLIAAFKEELSNLIAQGVLDVSNEAVMDIRFKLDYANAHLCSIIKDTSK